MAGNFHGALECQRLCYSIYTNHILLFERSELTVNILTLFVYNL